MLVGKAGNATIISRSTLPQPFPASPWTATKTPSFSYPLPIVKMHTSRVQTHASYKRPSLASSIFYCLLLAFFMPLAASAQMKAVDAALNLQTLEDFHSAEQTMARKPITATDDSYRSKLENHQKAAQAAGNLKAVLAAKQAIGELDAGRSAILSADPDVAAIQKAYIAQRQIADAEAKKALAKVDQDHLASLKKLVVDLTKAGHLDQAQEVQAKVEEFTAILNPKAGAPAQSAGQQEEDIWKKKAMGEFPSLSDSASPLSKKVQSLREAKKLTPSFFRNPQWPYLLAKEASLALQQATIASNNPMIPAESKSYNGKKYFVYEDPCDWTTARNRCRKLGGQLVVIPDEPTQAFIKELAGGRLLWLGATDEKKEGVWMWVDGTKMQYKSFDSGQPNDDRKSEKFLMIKGGLWHDVPEKVDRISGYICEWPDK